MPACVDMYVDMCIDIYVVMCSPIDGLSCGLVTGPVGDLQLANPRDQTLKQ